MRLYCDLLLATFQIEIRENESIITLISQFDLSEFTSYWLKI